MRTSLLTLRTLSARRNSQLPTSDFRLPTSVAAPGRNPKSGFTLMEILVVIVIIGILSSVVGVSVLRHIRKAKRETARLQIKNFQVALKTYQMEQGQLPTEEQGLAALCRKPSAPPIPTEYPEEGYLDSIQLPLDPWGRPYIYLVPGREGARYEIISYGGDGEPGGEKEAADISSAELQRVAD